MFGALLREIRRLHQLLLWLYVWLYLYFSSLFHSFRRLVVDQNPCLVNGELQKSW